MAPPTAPTAHASREADAPVAEVAKSEDPGPPPPAPPPPHTVDPLAPKGASLELRISFAATRGLPLAPHLAKLALAVPDPDVLLGGGGLELELDFDEIVVATWDMLDFRSTFVVIRHRLPREQMQQGLERAAALGLAEIEWVTQGDELRGNPRPIDRTIPDVDPRWLVLRNDGTVIYALEELLAPSGGAKPAADTIAGFFGATTAKRKGRAKHALSLRIAQLGNVARMPSLPFAIPDPLDATVTALAEHEVRLQLGFGTDEEARAFASFWTDDLPKLLESQLAMTLVFKPIIDRFQLTRKGKGVRLRGRFATAQLVPLGQVAVEMATRRRVKALASTSASPQPSPAPPP